MTAETSVILGLGVISATLGYFAFELSRSDQEVNQRVGLFLGFMSLAFLNVVMFAVFKISETSLPYLTSGVMQTGLLIMMWSTLGIVFVLLISIIWMTIKALWDFFNKAGRREDNTDDE